MPGDFVAQQVVVNGRTYRLPQRPVAVICLDGCDPDYLVVGLAAGELPTFARIAHDGFAGEALSALPSFTNPNNCSIVTGVPPAVHGVSGNFYLDRRTGETVMVTGDKELKVPTILAAMAASGVPTAVVTAIAGQQRARAAGVRFGRPTIPPHSVQRVRGELTKGKGIRQTARQPGESAPNQTPARSRTRAYADRVATAAARGGGCDPTNPPNPIQSVRDAVRGARSRAQAMRLKTSSMIAPTSCGLAPG